MGTNTKRAPGKFIGIDPSLQENSSETVTTYSNYDEFEMRCFVRNFSVFKRQKSVSFLNNKQTFQKQKIWVHYYWTERKKCKFD